MPLRALPGLPAVAVTEDLVVYRKIGPKLDMPKLSAVITTYNNARTLSACLGSVAWVDEIVVIDSFSSDETPQIAAEHAAQFIQHRFLGYGAQKQLAVDQASHDWVLLLDADEMLSADLSLEIQQLMAGNSRHSGYTMPRHEQLFWRMSHPAVRMNRYLRLFDRRRGALSGEPVHAAPKVDGLTGQLKAPFYHFGEVDIHVKTEKLNAYSSGMALDKVSRGAQGGWLRLIFYPPLVFLRHYLFKRHFLNGRAGYISAIMNAHYAFLKYAKVYEARCFEGSSRFSFPEHAPPSPEPRNRCSSV